MLGIKNVLKPTDVLTNRDLYYGTSSRLVQNYDSEEEFSYYDFDFDKYVEENDIDKVLFIISPTFLTKEDRNQGLENVI